MTFGDEVTFAVVEVTFGVRVAGKELGIGDFHRVVEIVGRLSVVLDQLWLSKVVVVAVVGVRHGADNLGAVAGHAVGLVADAVLTVH